MEINGSYGSGYTPCTILTHEADGGTWYCVLDSKNVNFTYDPITEGQNVEELNDADSFTWDEINSLEELIEAVED